jgi:hypothetical protein
MLVLAISFAALVGAIQAKIFVPEESLIWIFKYPFSMLIIIYEIYIIFGVMCVLSKEYRSTVIPYLKTLIKRNKTIFVVFITLNIVMLYSIFVDVAAITDHKIINYTILSPGGRQYSFNDIEKIETGVTGKKFHFFFSHYSKGDFYYIMQLKDGTRIHLTDVGGTRNDEHETFIIERLDRQFVNMGIDKKSSMKNFEYCKDGLGKIYTDAIRNTLTEQD